MVSLEERMKDLEERQKIANVLNSNSLYCLGVLHCGYNRITINVKDNCSKQFSYTSFNSKEDGRIINIREGIHDPDIFVDVDAWVLEEILDKEQEILNNPVKYALRYQKHFKMPLKQKAKILTGIATGYFRRKRD